MERTKDLTLVSLEVAAEQFEIGVYTLRRRIAAGEIPVFIDGKDRRRRLVSIEDLERVFAPRLLDPAA